MLTAVILAAGEGKRMKSDKSKVLHNVCGLPLVKWVVRATDIADNKIVVVGHKAEQVKEELGDTVNFAMQLEQKGTGHAVMQAESFLKENDGDVVILSGDSPLITKETLTEAYKYHQLSGNAATVLTAHLENPFGYGRVLRKPNGDILKIVEQKDATPEELKTTEINSGMYFFNCQKLLEALKNLTNNNAQGEYYLTDTIEILLSKGLKCGAYIVTDETEILGINDRIQLAAAEEIMQGKINKALMENGVTFIAPKTAYIGADVEIGKDTVIMPNTIIEGKCTVGSNCIIGPNSRIVDSNIDDDTEINNSVVLKSTVGKDTHVGPFAYVRPNSAIGNNIKIGDFVEVKNSKIDDGTKVSHLTYIGDADIGKRVNFGCGTVIVNYDGKKKYRSTVGDDAFIGCNTNLVSPVEVGEGSFIAAGSTITRNIPPKNLAVARSRQVNKDNWIDRRNK